MRNLLLYVSALAGICYLAILHNSKSLFMLSAAVLLLPPFFLCMLWQSKRRLACRLSVSSYPDEEGKYQVFLEAENKSIFYLPEIRTKVILKNAKSGRKVKVKLAGQAGARERVTLAKTAGYLEFGLWQASCRFVTCYDCLGIFRLKKKVRQTVQVIVLPGCHETNIKVGLRTRFFLSDGDWYHPQIGGDDPTEILKLREYQEGDRLNQIHWKLSARNDGLIVAERSMPVGCNVVVFLDAQMDALGRKKGRAYWETAHTISQGLLSQECCHFLVWYEKKEQRLQRKAIREFEDLADFWGGILDHQMGRCDFVEKSGQQFPGEAYVSYIWWNQELELYCNGEFQVKIAPGRVKEQLLEVELRV